MARATGRPPGRPASVRRLVRLAVQDAAPAALDAILKAARLGDVPAALAVLELALQLEQPKPGANE